MSTTHCDVKGPSPPHIPVSDLCIAPPSREQAAEHGCHCLGSGRAAAVARLLSVSGAGTRPSADRYSD